MSDWDQNSPPHEDVFDSVGQWNPPLTKVSEMGQWKNTGRISLTGNWEAIDEEQEPDDDDDDDPGSLRNLLSTLETDNPINAFKRSGAEEFENAADLEKRYEEALKKWIGSKEFAASDQHRLPYSYYNRTVRIRFPKFSRGHKPGDFKEYIRRYVGGDRVKALGMLPLPNEWQMTLKAEKDREKLLRQKKVKIGSRNVWITPISCHEVRGMVHWLPMSVSNASIAGVLGIDGTVLFVETLDPKEKVELKHHAKGVRYFSMYLHRDKTLEDVPRLITVEECTAFIGIPGRAPTCFHCKKEGHRKKECPIFNMMKMVHEGIQIPGVRRARKKKTSLATKSTGDPSATYKDDLETEEQGDLQTADKGDLGISGQGDLGNTGQGGSETISQFGLETTDQDDLESTDQGDLGSADQGGLETTGRDDLGTAVQAGLKTAGQGDQGIAGQDNKGTAEQDDLESTGQCDPESTGQGDPELTKNVEAVALAKDKQVKEKSVDNLVEAEKYKDIVAELQKLETELQQTLDETMDGLKEKMERGSRILHDLLSLK